MEQHTYFPRSSLLQAPAEASGELSDKNEQQEERRTELTHFEWQRDMGATSSVSSQEPCSHIWSRNMETHVKPSAVGH